MSALSPELMYFASRMSGFSTNVFKLETNNSTSATSNSIISVDLPSNSIINLRSFAMICKASANKTGTNNNGGRLPPIKDLIERVEVTMGGVVLSQGTNFTNVLCEAKKSLARDYTDACVGHPAYIRATSYVNPADVYTATANEDDGDNYYVVNEWEGFLGTADPMLFDTALVPPIRIRLYCATDNVLSSVNSVVLGTATGSFADSAGANATSGAPLPLTAVPATPPKYELTDIHFNVEAINLADMTYENLLAQQMGQNGDLEVPYKAFYTFVDTHTGSSKFSVASSSMDRIWLAWRGSDYNTVSPPITVGGHKIQGCFTDATAGAGTTLQDVGKPQYDIGGVLDTNNELYKGRYFNFSQPVLNSTPTVEWKAQIQLNGSYMPQFSANITELYQLSKNSLEGRAAHKEMTLDQYRNNSCVQCFRLNMPNSEYSRTLSGIDSRATNLAGVVRTENAGTGLLPNLNIFVECTEILNIGAGRSISVVV